MYFLVTLENTFTQFSLDDIQVANAWIHRWVVIRNYGRPECITWQV